MKKIINFVGATLVACLLAYTVSASTLSAVVTEDDATASSQTTVQLVVHVRNADGPQNWIDLYIMDSSSGDYVLYVCEEQDGAVYQPGEEKTFTVNVSPGRYEIYAACELASWSDNYIQELFTVSPNSRGQLNIDVFYTGGIYFQNNLY